MLRYLVLSVVVACPALAQRGLLPDSPVHQLFLSGSAGVSWAVFQHPMLTATTFAPTYTLQAGYAISPRFVVSAELEGLSQHVRREQHASPFDLVAAGARCETCVAGPEGGWIASTTVSFTTVAARFDVSPFGETGPYAAGVLGVALSDGFPLDRTASFSTVGVSAGGRLGVRFRVNHTLEVLGEAGFQGQFYDRAQVLLPSAHGMVRLYL